MDVANGPTVLWMVRSALNFWRRGASGAAAILAFCGASAGWCLYIFDQPDPAARLVAAAVLVLLTLLAEAALYRIAFSARPRADESMAPGPLGLQFGTVELSVVGAGLLQAALLVALFGPLAVLVSRPPPGRLARWSDLLSLDHPLPLAVAAAVAGVTLWALARLSLHGAASAAQGRVRLTGAAPLTRGMALRILAAMLLLAAPAALAAAAMGALWQAAGGSGIIPDPVQAAVRIACGLALAFYLIPLGAGLTGQLYLRLTEAAAPNERAR